MKRFRTAPRATRLGDYRERSGETALNVAVSRVLASGLVAAVALLLAGIVLALARPTVPIARETSLADLPAALAAFEPGGFFELGLLVLIATPVARVLALQVGFAQRKAWLFCGFGVFVLGILALSTVLGLRG
jgi:uncharacterized membrane protein